VSEENKAIARRVYEIVSTGDFERATEIVDQDAPDNELLPHDPPARLIDTFKETFAEAREGFPDLSITVEDVMAEGDRVAARVTMRGTHRGAF
jgi:predicted ester cyclase